LSVILAEAALGRKALEKIRLVLGAGAVADNGLQPRLPPDMAKGET
jgi:hypothetical protein